MIQRTAQTHEMQRSMCQRKFKGMCRALLTCVHGLTRPTHRCSNTGPLPDDPNRQQDPTTQATLTASWLWSLMTSRTSTSWGPTWTENRGRRRVCDIRRTRKGFLSLRVSHGKRNMRAFVFPEQLHRKLDSTMPRIHHHGRLKEDTTSTSSQGYTREPPRWSSKMFFPCVQMKGKVRR